MAQAPWAMNTVDGGPRNDPPDKARLLWTFSDTGPALIQALRVAKYVEKCLDIQPTRDERETAAYIYGRYLTNFTPNTIPLVFVGGFATMLWAGNVNMFPPPPQCLEILIAAPDMEDLYRPFFTETEALLRRTVDGEPVVILYNNQQQWSGVLVEFIPPGLHGYPFQLIDSGIEPNLSLIQCNDVRFPVLRPRFLLLNRILHLKTLVNETQKLYALAEIQVLLDCAARELTPDGHGRFSPFEAGVLVPVVAALLDFAESQGIYVTREHLEIWMVLGIDLRSVNLGTEMGNEQSNWRRLLRFFAEE